MQRIAVIVVGTGLLLVTSGCVERRFVVTSDPPGAVVLRNNQPIGNAPADDHFLYYGNYHFTLVKDGYQTLQVDQDVPAPWYQYLLVDFIAENVIPWRIEDVRRFHYKLEPVQMPNPEEVLNRGEGVRSRGKAVGTAVAPTTDGGR